MQDNPYLILDVTARAWLGDNYARVLNILDASRYSRDDAIQICAAALAAGERGHGLPRIVAVRMVDIAEVLMQYFEARSPD